MSSSRKCFWGRKNTQEAHILLDVSNPRAGLLMAGDRVLGEGGKGENK